MAQSDLFGVLAQFGRPQALVEAAARVRQAGYRRFGAYSPMPLDGLADAMAFPPSRMALVVLLGGLIGGLSGYLLQYWVSVVAYPLNVGGRPLHSWPAFIPVTFEMTILGASLAAVLGMLALNGLPRPHHPLFAISRFDRATQDSFFLCILATDPKFDRQSTRAFLETLDPLEVEDVPA